MNLLPTSTRSSVSIPKYCQSDSASAGYPSPAMDKQHRRTSLAYDTCSMATDLATDRSSPRSDTFIAPQWNPPSDLHPALTSASLATVGNTEYDAFSSYGGSLAANYSDDSLLNRSQPSASTALPIPRSPVTSLSRLSLQHSILSESPSPRLMPQQYSQNVIDSQYTSPSLAHTTYAADIISATCLPHSGPPSAPHSVSGYTSDCNLAPWPRADRYTSDVEQYTTSGMSSPGFDSVSRQDRNPSHSDDGQKRPPRKLTTREEANFRCDVKGCGKFFSRSYNFKAHMETHREKREYPFPCQVGDCTKKFVRKTDLQRHHQSVHMKERNHGCEYCGRMFARRDTLKR